MGFLELFTGSNRGAPVTAANPIPTKSVNADGSPAPTGSPASPVTVVSGGFDMSIALTRPANQTPYSAKAVVFGAFEIPIAERPGASVLLTNVEFEIDTAGLPSGMTSFRLYLYSASPPSAFADNAAWDLPAGDRSSFLGYVDLGVPVDLGSTLYVLTDSLQRQLRAVSTSLHFYLVTNGGYTPAAPSEVYKITLHGMSL